MPSCPRSTRTTWFRFREEVSIARNLPVAVATRELHEETGLVAKAIAFLFSHESLSNVHQVFFAVAEGDLVVADDAQNLVFLKGAAIASDCCYAGQIDQSARRRLIKAKDTKIRTRTGSLVNKRWSA
jgi:hypothetical protein